MEYTPLKDRLSTYIKESGIKIYKIAEFAEIEPQIIYNLNSGVIETLSEKNAVQLHKYLTDKGY